MNRIHRASVADLSHAHQLLNEYFDAIGVVLRDDDEGIRAFLADSSAAMWIAYVDAMPAACVAMRRLPEMAGASECKRLYVKPAFRRLGLAASLMAALERHAALEGYDAVYLDTKDDLVGAIKLYDRLGYERCERYNDNPQATIFMRKRLA